jgi:hypothetical protein
VASRLYRTTRRLYIQISSVLSSLGIADLGSPTTVGLIALYVTGLILLDVHQTQTRVTRFLPTRCHDALNRLLRVMPLSTRALMALLIGWIKQQKAQGYLCLDDVVVEKAWAKWFIRQVYAAFGTRPMPERRLVRWRRRRPHTKG